MADISLTLSNLQDTVEKTSSSIKTLDSAFSEMSDALKDHVDKVDKSTKRQEDAIKRQQQAVDKLTRSIQNNLSSITSEFTKQIPIIGKSLQNGIDSILKGMQRPLEALSRFVLGNKNLSGVLTAAGGGLLASAALIFKEFQKIENAVVSISKQTGFYGQQLKNVRDMTIEAYKGNLQFGISMEKNAKSAVGLVTALGSQRRITQELIKFNAQLADYTGLSADQTGKLMSTMIKGFGMTTNQVKNFIGQLATATAGGQATATIIRDMAANSNLVAMHAAKGAQYLLDMSAYSRLTNINMNKMQSMTDVFLNFDSGTELINKLNVAFGGSLNSMEMFSKAMKGDVVGVMDDLHTLLSSPQGLRTLQMYPGYARQLGQQLGMNYDEMLKIARMTKSDLELAKQQQGEQARINDILREQRTTFENMKNMLIAEFLPGFTNLAQRAMTMIKPLKQGMLYVRDMYRGLRSVMGGSDVAAISTIAVAIPTLVTVVKALVGRGVSRLAPMFVSVVNGGGVGGGVGGGGGRVGKANVGVAALGTLASAASFSGGGDTIDKVLSLITMIAPFFGPKGMALAAGAAGVGMLKNMFFDKAATGRVVSNPSLFMVGEENRREVIIPTERIRNGMPVSSDVANELASIGVPGFFDGGFVTGGDRTTYGNRNRGVVRDAGSFAEQTRREQEAMAINRAYRRDLKAQHDERLSVLMDIERNTGDGGVLGGGGRAGSSLGGLRLPGAYRGTDFSPLTDPIKELPKNFMEGFKDGFVREYQEWRKSLTGDYRQTVELLHNMYDMWGEYRRDGWNAVGRYIATNKGMEQRLDWIVSNIGNEGSFLDRNSMAITQGIRAMSMSRVLDNNWKKSIGIGLSTALLSAGRYGTQNILNNRQAARERRSNRNQVSVPSSMLMNNTTQRGIAAYNMGLGGGGYDITRYGNRLRTAGMLGFGSSGIGFGLSSSGGSATISEPEQTGSGKGWLSGAWDAFIGGSDDEGNLTGVTKAADDLDKVFRISKIYNLGKGAAGSGMNWVKDRGLYKGASKFISGLGDTRVGKFVGGQLGKAKSAIFGEGTPGGGFWSSAGGAAALQGLGTAGLQLATGGFGKRNVAAAVQSGTSAAGAALMAAGPAGMIAGLGLQIGGALLGDKIAGSSKAVKRGGALADLQRAIENQDLSTFSQASRKKLKQASEGKSSRGRTLVAIQSMFANAGLKNNEIGNLFSYLTDTDIDESTTAFWNKKLFGKESETLDDKNYQEIQDKMAADPGNLDALQASADNILERWRKDRGYKTKKDAVKALGLTEDEARDITQLTEKIGSAAGGSEFLERHMMSMSKKEYAQSKDGGGGGGGVIQMPPELTQMFMELNQNVRNMGEAMGEETFNIVVELSGERIGQYIHERNTQQSTNGT